ncbi:hypothetical protein AGMMS4956_19340 [Bacteroidia bacterium]|nr:hypothetical protein AGMMS4956_19340 [Bacteroidia bacterium]
MKKYIYSTRDIAAHFGVSMQAVRDALRDRTKSDLSNKIREIAPQYLLFEQSTENNSIKIIIPPRGYQNELAKLAGCTRQTVIMALRHNGRGVIAERVRQLYMAKYSNNE